METINRRYRAEVLSPAGRWVFGEWIAAQGTGLLTDRLEREARTVLSSEPAGSTVIVYRYVAHSDDPMRRMFSLTLPLREA